MRAVTGDNALGLDSSSLVSAKEVFDSNGAAGTAGVAKLSATQEWHHSPPADATPLKSGYSASALLWCGAALWMPWIHYTVCLWNMPRHFKAFTDYQNIWCDVLWFFILEQSFSPLASRIKCNKERWCEQCGYSMTEKNAWRLSNHFQLN